ncbi:MAG: stage V sporulation protein AD [Lachnospiraceae bacterium]|nr:stage V sporulation protein AD [Lachnospiraceae bacterium]
MHILKEDKNKKEELELQTIGKQSICFAHPPYILSSASVVGKKEGEGPLGAKFDMICDDDKFGSDTWEEAESTLQKEAASLAMGKAKLENKDIRYIFAGDLLGQTIATSFGLMDYQIPLFGLYGACSTAGESMALGAMCVAAGYAKRVLTVTSSHFASAEKQFRYPLEYANQRPMSATWTVTGSGAFVLGQEKAGVKICGLTPGRIVDYGVRDSMNMGAAMAPAACDTIYHHFEDFDRKPSDYDKIITGDLGSVGQEILIKLLKDKGYDISSVHTDCGIEIFDSEKQGTDSGGSGCGCSAVTLSAHFLPKLMNGEWKRVLFVPTGALLSTVSFNEGQNVPGIAHAVILEAENE